MRKTDVSDKRDEGYPNTVRGRLEAVDPRIVALESVDIGQVNRCDRCVAGHLDFESLCAEHSDADGVFTIRELIESHARLERTVRDCQGAFDLIMAACDTMGHPLRDYSVPSVINAIGGYACDMALRCDIEQDIAMGFLDEAGEEGAPGGKLAELLGIGGGPAKARPQTNTEGELRELAKPARSPHLPFLNEDTQHWCLSVEGGDEPYEYDSVEDVVRAYCRGARTRYRYDRRGAYSYMANSYALSWCDLLDVVLRYPESFYLPEGAETDYSPQELRVIANLRAQLLMDGARDRSAVRMPEGPLERLEDIFRRADAQAGCDSELEHGDGEGE